MAVVRMHLRGMEFQTQHEDVQDLFWKYGFYCQCERMVKKGPYHPYKNNRCSAFVWVLSSDVDALLQTKMKQGVYELQLKDAVDNGQQMQPPHWLVRIAEREDVTCLHHLPCRTLKQLFTVDSCYQNRNMLFNFCHLDFSLDPEVLVNWS